MAQESMIWTVVGFVASFFTSIASLPQILKVWKSKHVGDLSVQTMALFIIGAILWLAYGIALMSWPIIIVNSVFLFFQGILVWLKIRYSNH